MKEVILDTLLDTAKTVVLLFISYLVIEYFEKKFEGKTEQLLIKKSGFSVLGASIAGIIPQCGLAAGAASLYAGGIISAGTLIALFISSSDEMLPLLISFTVPAKTIAAILSAKVIFAIIFGYTADAAFFKSRTAKDICADSNCNCEEDGILRSALRHTLNVGIFLLLTGFLLNCAVYFIGEDTLSALVITKPYIAEVVCSLIGLIPNCASSVILTRLFIEGIIPSGALIAGLCINSGVGIMVLYKTNRPMKENLRITLYLFVSSVLAGFILELVGFSL